MVEGDVGMAAGGDMEVANPSALRDQVVRAKRERERERERNLEGIKRRKLKGVQKRQKGYALFK